MLCSDAAELVNHVLWDCPFGMQELIVASYNAVLLNLFEVGLVTLVVEEIRNMAFVGPYLILKGFVFTLFSPCCKPF